MWIYLLQFILINYRRNRYSQSVIWYNAVRNFRVRVLGLWYAKLWALLFHHIDKGSKWRCGAHLYATNQECYWFRGRHEKTDKLKTIINPNHFKGKANACDVMSTFIASHGQSMRRVVFVLNVGNLHIFARILGNFPSCLIDFGCHVSVRWRCDYRQCIHRHTHHSLPYAHPLSVPNSIYWSNDLNVVYVVH